MLLGAHTSTAGGYKEGVRRAYEIGCNCVQIFSTSPRGWKVADPSDEQIEEFKKAKSEYGVDPVYFHASYLINLAGSPEGQEKSVDALVAELKTAGRAGVRGSVVHVGSFKKQEYEEFTYEEYKEVIENIRTILKRTPSETFFIIENMGMRKIGRQLEEIAFLVKELNDPRVKVCLDTCHLHVAGFDLSSAEKLDQFLGHFDELIGLGRLEVIHINDSRDEFGSLRDRHDNIGEGKVDKKVFSLLLNHPKLAHVPFIAEVPGFDGQGPDKENIDRLKKVIKAQ